jgi:inosine-uridine nucleoside N-ribohydrolase
MSRFAISSFALLKCPALLNGAGFVFQGNPGQPRMRLKLKLSVILVCGILQTANASVVWIDTDPSIGSPWREVDDAYALVLAFHSPDLRIAGISTTYGNASLHDTTRIARDLTDRFGKPAGLTTANVFAGASASSDLGHPTPASDALALALRKNRKVTYIALGPLTNIATFLTLHRELSDRIEKIIFVGGRSPETTLALGPRNWFHVHDANVVKDQAAVEIILRSNVPLVLVPIETSSKLLLNATDLRELAAAGGWGDYLCRKSQIWLWFWTKFVRMDGGPIFDALAICATQSRLVATEKRYAALDSPGNLLAQRHFRRNSRPVRFCTALARGTKRFVLRRLCAPAQ